MDATSDPSASVVAQLLARALGGPVVLVTFDAAGRQTHAGFDMRLVDLAPTEAQRAELREGRRTELEHAGRRWLALGAEDERGRLWVALQPADGRVPLARFAQHLVHAVRNSMASIKLAVQTTARAETTKTRERQRLAIAGRELGRLERIVTTASEFARTPTRGAEALAAADLLRAAAEVVAPELEARGVRLQLEVDADLPRLTGDGFRVQLALENLLAFGARAMPEGGPLEVRLARDGSGLRLSVRDHGAGVPEGDLPRLFVPLASGGRAPGLDLALLEQVAGELRGEAFAENANPGLRVTVRLGVDAGGVHGHAAAGR